MGRTLAAAIMEAPTTIAHDQGRLTAGRRGRCFLDLPVYDAVGIRKEFTISGAMLIDGDSRGVELPLSGKQAARPVPGKARLPLSAKNLGAAAELQLTGPQGKHTSVKAEMKDCEQRVSVQSGSRDIGGCVALSRITGRIAGCGTRGHWWVRAAPICKGDASVQRYEGYVRPAGGTSAIAGSFSGARHTVSSGNGRDPVNVVAIDVVEGARTDWARLTSAAFVESDLHGIARRRWYGPGTGSRRLAIGPAETVRVGRVDRSFCAFWQVRGSEERRRV